MNEIETYVSEAYYGQLPEFAELEKLFDSIIKKAKSDGYNKCNPNKYPENAKIQKIFTKLFGFKKSFLYWEPFAVANAYTVSLNAFLVFTDKKKMIEKRPDKGFYDTSHTVLLTVYVSTGLFETGLTARELLAVILHEIGHNFDYSNYHKFEMILWSLVNWAIPIEIANYKNNTNDVKTDMYIKISDQGDAIYKNQKKRDAMIKRMKLDERNYYKYQKRLRGLIMTLTGFIQLPVSIILSPITPILNIGGEKSEIFADSFATAYGYGTELMSALNKLQDHTAIYDPKSPVSRFLLDMGTLMGEVMQLGTGEVHGTDMKRCKECLKKLKHDLRTNDFPPELKQELVEEINRLTRVYKSYYKIEPGDRLKITKMYRKMIALVFQGNPSITKFLGTHKV
uniref:Peptidase M48 domain-containing protein n=1 Tax=Myoviridae sp. ctaOv25 TaxID=2827290 RepID=A0A8S5R503_9CAUD|nr:MAG TPA: hypothetical protein [Myoviridae sp. ctaOv25]